MLDLAACLTGFQASIQKERDALLAEKEAWSKSAAPSTIEGASSGSWEEEKTQMLKERDEALASCKVSRSRSFFAQFSTRPAEIPGPGDPAEEPA